jgi:hypothetical protein
MVSLKKAAVNPKRNHMKAPIRMEFTPPVALSLVKWGWFIAGFTVEKNKLGATLLEPGLGSFWKSGGSIVQNHVCHLLRISPSSLRNCGIVTTRSAMWLMDLNRIPS